MDDSPTRFILNQSSPYHEQIRRYLERRIKLGLLKSGDQLPSEAELQRTFEVSRTPVRQALDALESDGIIYRSQGRGSFVRDRKIGGSLDQMISFGPGLWDAGHTVEAKTLTVERATCSQEIEATLDCLDEEKITYIRRLFIVDDEPLVLFDHYLKPMLPAEYFIQQGNFQSLFQLLSDEGFEPFEGIQSISAGLVNEEEASLLNITLPAAVLMIKQVYYAATGAPLWCSRFLVRADRYEYKVRLGRGNI